MTRKSKVNNLRKYAYYCRTTQMSHAVKKTHLAYKNYIFGFKIKMNIMPHKEQSQIAVTFA